MNLDNPEVLGEIRDIMRFWLDLGVDALRLDAIPYLIEREGTINENLPETHAILKLLRHELDERYSGRVLLAEANQWPSDVRAYFGDGDECHMAFHFPLMPRMFMALRQEDRHPIVEILNQTPEIPESCQWTIFLRNHDELTLEMVTDEERDYMYSQYAADPQMRVNVGIRRRLAPLMENSRPRIELMNSLLLSLPGTPIVYYGDEIGMGDNVYLGDRNGVRTPMQWSSDRNAGFSRVRPGAVVRPRHHGSGVRLRSDQRRGAGAFAVLAAALDEADDRPQEAARRCSGAARCSSSRRPTARCSSTCGATSATASSASPTSRGTFNRSRFRSRPSPGSRQWRCWGQTEFPRIGEHPYFLTLAPYGFYWFQLQEVVAPITARTAPAPEEPAALPSLFSGVVWESILDGGLRTIVERHALVPFLHRQRWFGAKARSLAAARFVDWALLRSGPTPAFLTLVETEFHDGGRDRYLVPLATANGSDAELFEHEHAGRCGGAHHGRPKGPGVRRSLRRRGLRQAARHTPGESGTADATRPRYRHGAAAPTGPGATQANRAQRRPQQLIDPVRQARDHEAVPEARDRSAPGRRTERIPRVARFYARAAGSAGTCRICVTDKSRRRSRCSISTSTTRETDGR